MEKRKQGLWKQNTISISQYTWSTHPDETHATFVYNFLLYRFVCLLSSNKLTFQKLGRQTKGNWRSNQYEMRTTNPTMIMTTKLDVSNSTELLQFF